MKNKPNKDIFQRYINNQTTEEENLLIDTWYLHFLKSGSTSNEEIEWQKVVKRIEYINRHKRNKIFTFSSYLKVASVLIILFSIIFMVYKLRETDSSTLLLEEIYAYRSDGYMERGGVKTPLMATDTVLDLSEEYLKQIDISSTVSNHPNEDSLFIKGPSGQNFLVSLPDGSQIILNSQSEIHLPINFSIENRNVSLIGEAKFKIQKHDEGKAKFNVRFGNHTIEVLGTEFNIQSNAQLENIHITLLSGKVKLNNQTSSPIFLTKGDNYTYNKRSGSYSVQNDLRENDKQISWVNQDFQFDKTSLVDICSVLSDWYKFEIQLGDATLNQETFTGILSRTKNLGDVLDIININSQYKYNVNMKERRIVIDKE